MQQFTYYEFFAGGGMARAGLGEGWRCLFANDIDPKKAATYRANWGGEELWVGDVAEVTPEQLPIRRTHYVYCLTYVASSEIVLHTRWLGPVAA